MMRPAKEWAVVLAGTLWSLPTLPDHARQYLTIDSGDNAGVLQRLGHVADLSLGPYGDLLPPRSRGLPRRDVGPVSSAAVTLA
jgi:hypothetical protein